MRTDAPFIDSPRDARYHHAKRFGIDTSYRLSKQSIATTSTQNPVVRLLYVVVSLLLQNVWRHPSLGENISGNRISISP